MLAFLQPNARLPMVVRLRPSGPAGMFDVFGGTGAADFRGRLFGR